ncbi:hypothetical protein A6A04_19705 [Paramagnetospirillum marisnigri]|uniref:LPP20 lipoprotein n=1 Tax=Paramagnetospirillum marisnigri TaxID=1285242 RepID=A0A178ML08_9PROT|nr:hypothetical protein [Paramagnetospirillum marisnigri]OAN48827.1 hypothetical protein A6A04_19705 [Paramagnetospirillum marisnigri]
MTRFRSILAVVLALSAPTLIAGCATPEPGSPAAVALAHQKQQEMRADQVKDTVSDAPSWFTAPPKDEFSLYAPGTATSSDMQMAVDKATLNGKRIVADRLKSLLSAKMKDFASESGMAEDARVMSEVERVTTNVVTEANMAGYQAVKSEIKPQGTQYRAYVLVQYPLGEANRIMVDQTRKSDLLDGKLRASKAFLDLEKDIQAARGGKP